MNNPITWKNHIWALAIFAGCISSALTYSYLTSKINLLCMMFFMSQVLVKAILWIPLLTSLFILIKHVFLHDAKKNTLERACFVVNFVLFAFTFIDRILLGGVSDVIVADMSSSQKGLNFFATMSYILIHNWRTFYTGIIHTLELAFAGTIVGFAIALLLVFLRTTKPDKRDAEWIQALKLTGNAFASFYVTIIRGTPMMVQGLIIYYAGFRLIRSLFPGMSVSELNGIYSVFLASAITVSLNTAAYITEILRGSVEAIDKGQMEAARSLGLSSWQTMRKVIFPQAIRNSIPAICNEFIINIKDTSVLNAVGMTELMFMTTTVAGTYYVYLETYMITAVIYLILTVCMQAIMNFFAKRMDMPVQHGVPSSN